MRVALLVSGSLLDYKNGVHTFIKSLSSMLAANHIVDIIVDETSNAAIECYADPARARSNLSYMKQANDISKVPEENRALYSMQNWTIPALERSLSAYLMTHKPNVVIANDIATAAVLVDASNALLAGVPCYYYGHFPDDIFDVGNMKDISADVLAFHRDNLKRRGAMRFLSSTHTAVSRYSKFGPALYAPMPCQNYFATSAPGSKKIWVNSGNYARKRLELMTQIATAAGFEIVKADGVSAFDAIVEGAVNCAVMLHLSVSDIMPYAVLEACGAMHVVLADDAEWANELPITNYSKIPVNDISASAKLLKRIVNKAATFRGDDMMAYSSEVEAIWQEILL